jgi:hypothetical protein
MTEKKDDGKATPTKSQKLLKTLKTLFTEAIQLDTPKKKDPRREYPETVAEVIDDEMKFRPAVYAAMKDFRASKPWQGTQGEMQFKLRALNQQLAGIYEIEEPKMVFVDKMPGGGCCFRSKPAVIMLQPESEGRYSVVAYLHEFAHSIGKDEKGACKWSINLFKRIFPNSYNALEPDGHLLRKKST